MSKRPATAPTVPEQELNQQLKDTEVGGGCQALIPLGDLPSLLPAAPSGKPIAHLTLWRWATTGQHGVFLETVRLGRRFYSSVENVIRFGEELAKQSRRQPHATTTTHTDDHAGTSHESAMAELRKQGLVA
jgi:hypothetical protein